MAITLTEIGGQNSQFKVDGLPDFITEKTAKQLVDVLNKMGGNSSRGSTASVKNAGTGNSTFSEVKRTANEFANNIKKENQQRKGMIDNLKIERAQRDFNAKSSVSLSRSLLAFGSALGTAGFALLRAGVGYAGEAMMKYVGTMEASIQAGTGFALNVNNFGNTLSTRATGMAMTFDELAGVFNTFTGVTALGAERFADLLQITTDINSPLIALGMSAAEAAELVGRETQFRVNQIGVIDVGSKNIQDSLIEASDRAIDFAQVLGQSVNEFVALRHAALQTGDSFIGLARGNEEMRARQYDTMTKFADEMIRIGGESGSAIAAAFIDAAGKGALGFSDAAVGIVRALPGMNKEFQNLRMGLLTGELNEGQMRERMNDLLLNQSESTRQRLFILARAGDESAAQLIQFTNNAQRAERTITMFGLTTEDVTKDQVEQFSRFRRGIDGVRSMFSNFLITAFSSEAAISGMNKAMNTLLNALIPGSASVDGFGKNLKLNADKIKQAAEEFGVKFGDMVQRMAGHIDTFIRSFRTAEQNKLADDAKAAQANNQQLEKDIKARQAYLLQNNGLTQEEQQKIKDKIATDKKTIEANKNIITKASDIPGIFDAIGGALNKFLGVLESIVDNMEIILGTLALLVAGPLIGSLYRGGRFIANSIRTPAAGRTTVAGRMDQRTNAYRNLNRPQQALARTTAGTSAINFMNNTRTGRALNVGSKALGPASLLFSGYDIGTDLYKGLQDGTKMTGADLVDTYSNRSEGIAGSVGAAIGALGFFLGPVGFLTTSLGQMIGDSIGDAMTWSSEEITKLRNDGADPNRYKQVLTDKFIVPFGQSVDMAVSTSSEKFANILMTSMNAEDKYLDTQLSILEEDLAMAGSKKSRKRIEKDIEAIRERQQEMLKNSAEALGIDLDAEYEEGTEKFKQQQALLNAASQDNTDEDLRAQIIQQEQANYLRKIHLLLKDM